jgi:alkylation response protein AidB-like acyl-CoA dehydrogenase
MNFSLSDEQQMLADSARRFVQGGYQPDSLWRRFAELGWLALPFDEDDGGLGAGLVETMVLLEELGRGGVVAPYLATVVLGGGVLRRADAARRARYLPDLMAGDLQLALAVDEQERVFAPENTALQAREEGGGFVLSGRKIVVLNGDQADRILVLARTGGEPGDQQGLSLFLLDPHSPGVTLTPHRLVDGHRAARLGLEGVRLPADALILEKDAAFEPVRQVLDEAILALGAEAVGALSVLLDDTVEYSKTRKQFGVPIGSFQVLQHRMADMFMALEQTRSLLLAATLKIVEGHDDARQAVHALKARIGGAGRHIAQEAVQLHGGMGMTDELAVGHYFKRITAMDGLFGVADQHLAAFARG